jgi:superfamily II DNA or RNA helicase
LVVATPGAGKTKLGGTIAGRHVRSGRAELVVVVVPTERLKGQWADDIASCGIELVPDWSNADGVMPPGFDGVVVTYAQVAALPDLMRRHVATRSAVCLFDEIHHCGDSLSWGDALRHAFEPARWRISLSGTPFRSDNNAIPFVRYVDGAGTADITYDYGEAIADGVCRPVYFPRRGGRMEWATSNGEVLEATFDDQLDEPLANQRLRTALTLEGNWLTSVLDEAHGELTAVRRDVDDGAGLVLAADQAHARGIAELLRTRHGVDPVVVTCDDPDANERIERFARSSAPWLVAVRMVSEGVDIPRLRVGVYASAVTSELFFRQAVGRLVRVLDADAGETASCFIPDDPRLRSYAATIRAQRDHVLRQH